MDLDLETIARIAIAGIMLGSLASGLSHRKLADRAGGVVSRREDPTWFWLCMSFVSPPVLLSLIAFIIQPRWLDFSSIPLPAWARLAGLPLGLLCVGLIHWMFRCLGRNVTPTSVPRADATLVITGPYHWVRHPMYSLVLLLVLSIGLLAANWLIPLGGACAFILLALRSRVEEALLIDKFGDAYREYQSRTGRFFPRLRIRWTSPRPAD